MVEDSIPLKTLWYGYQKSFIRNLQKSCPMYCLLTGCHPHDSSDAVPSIRET